MPNWIINELEVTGDRTAINKVAAMVADEGTVDFHILLPMPELLRKGSPAQEYEGYPNGNVWALEHWGTKWNAQGSSKIKTQASETRSGWFFATAWSAPDLWFMELTKKVATDPTLIVSITLDYADVSDWSGCRIRANSDGATYRTPMTRKEVNDFLGANQ